MASTAALNSFVDEVGKMADPRPDCVVTCSGQSFDVHKIILHLHSPVLRRMITDNFKAYQPNVTYLEIRDFEPAVVKAMLNYFYKTRYDISTTVMTEVDFHVEVFKIACSYESCSLATAAFHNVVPICSPTVPLNGFTKMMRRLSNVLDHPDFKVLVNEMMERIRRSMTVLLQAATFCQLLRDQPQLSINLLKRIAQEPKPLIAPGQQSTNAVPQTTSALPQSSPSGQPTPSATPTSFGATRLNMPPQPSPMHSAPPPPSPRGGPSH